MKAGDLLVWSPPPVWDGAAPTYDGRVQVVQMDGARQASRAYVVGGCLADRSCMVALADGEKRRVDVQQLRPATAHDLLVLGGSA